VTEVHSDAAISGAVRQRPGYRALLESMRAGRVEVVLAESLDRISRDQEHVAAFYKHAEFYDVRVVTASEGEIGMLQVGLKGTMCAMFLRDLADRTRRGLDGRVRKGRMVGRLSYGYERIGGQLDARGEIERGLAKPNTAEAAVVVRIFREYAAGRSPKAIATALNAMSIPAPDGDTWSDATLRGKSARGTGLLRNPIYDGRLVWSRRKSLRDPDTGKRVRRRNPAEKVVEAEVPALRIVGPELWAAVQARLEGNRAPRDKVGKPEFWERRRPHYLLSGMVFCGVCRRTDKAVGKDYLACTAAKSGACTNHARVRRGPLDTRVCEALGRELMDPELTAEFVRAFTEEWNAEAASAETTEKERRRELAGVERKISNLLDALAEGGRGTGLLGRLAELEARREELVTTLADPRPPPLRLPYDLGEVYRARVAGLREMLAGGDASEALEAARALISRVVVTPPDGEGGPPGIELVGEFGAMMRLGCAHLPGSGQAPVPAVLSAPAGSVKGDQGGQCPPQRATSHQTRPSAATP
jgi:DNA invertase Pin-like site-specific DNA recombinase